MNLINEEMTKIFEISKSLNQSSNVNIIISEIDSNMKSYFIDRKNCSGETICDYDFNTPVELKEKINSMWVKQGDAYMQEYLLAVVVSAFKYRTNEKKNAELSAFIYEF